MYPIGSVLKTGEMKAWMLVEGVENETDCKIQQLRRRFFLLGGK